MDRTAPGMGVVLDGLLPVLPPLVAVARRLAAAAPHLGRVLAHRRPARRPKPAATSIIPTKTTSIIFFHQEYN